MLSFQEFVQARRGATAVEQLQRSRSVGRAFAHPLQQLDELKQLNRVRSSKQQEQQLHELPVSTHNGCPPTTAVCAVTAGQRHLYDSVEARGCSSEPQQLQQASLPSTRSASRAMPSPLLASRDNRRAPMHAQQHTTTTVVGAEALTATGGSPGYEQKQQPSTRDTTGKSSCHIAGRAALAVHPNASSTRIGSQLQTMTLLDVLPTPQHIMQKAANLTVPVTAYSRGSYSSPPTPLGGLYADRMQCNNDGVQLSHVESEYNSHFSANTTGAHRQRHSQAVDGGCQIYVPVTTSHEESGQQPHHKAQQQYNHHQQQTLPQPIEQGANNSQAAALRSLKQQQHLLQEMLRSHSFRQQSSPLQPGVIATAAAASVDMKASPAVCTTGRRLDSTNSADAKHKLCLLQQQLTQMKDNLHLLTEGTKATGVTLVHSSQLSRADSASKGMQQRRSPDAPANIPASAVPAVMAQQSGIDAHGVISTFSSQVPSNCSAMDAGEAFELTLSGTTVTETVQISHNSQQQSPHSAWQQSTSTDKSVQDKSQVQPPQPQGSHQSLEAPGPPTAAFISPESTQSGDGIHGDIGIQAAGFQCLQPSVPAPNRFRQDMAPATLTGQQSGSYSRQLMSSSQKDTCGSTDTRLKSSAVSQQLKAASKAASTDHHDAVQYLANISEQQQPVTADNQGKPESHLLLVARQHARQLQQQNDALVRVLERERQQHKRVQQLVHDVQLEMKECRAEYEVTLQVLRQENVALTAQLRKAMSTAGHQEVMDAYDTALAASAAKLQEAQAAAAALASQLTETELQMQQVQHLHSDNALTSAAGCFGDEDNDVNATDRSDSAAADAAIASAARRSKAADKASPVAVTGQTDDDIHGSRGMQALRQQLKHIERQLASQQQECSKLQRENIKLLQFKKQYTVVVSKLKDLTAVQEATAAAAEQAGLRAAAANGRADRLQSEVEQMGRDKAQMQSAEQELRQQVQQCEEQLQELQHKLCWAEGVALEAPNAKRLAGVQQSLVANTEAQDTEGPHAAPQHEMVTDQKDTCQNTRPAPNTPGEVACSADGNTTTNVQCSNTIDDTPDMNSRHLPTLGGLMGNRQLNHSASAPSTAVDADTTALSLARKLSQVLPGDALVQQQLSSLESAILTGIQQRKALAAQGQLLLGMVLGS